MARSIRYTISDSALGRMLVAASERGVCLLRFGEEDCALEEELRTEFPFAHFRRDGPALAAWSTQVKRYVAGELPELRLPLDVRASRYRCRIWHALRNVIDPGRGVRRVSGLLAESG